MGEVDDAHHAEDEGEPGGEEGVQPAEQDPLDDRVDPVHQPTPFRPRSRPLATWSAVSSGRRALEGRAALEQAVDPVGDGSAWARSCSTTSTVVPFAAIVGSAL